ncbi:hypothetical protein DICVIV_10250 [Dictyocaulus viviparus]|uniref:Cadherin domain-containing protein n=1 Tax=Dictyocaulus viviparus TaxID=29172 RepID=A0A0D8XGL8_DICVI|nr:hypothetical protein DICVIV_10250 [Dictyocaulus viviparus]
MTSTTELCVRRRIGVSARQNACVKEVHFTQSKYIYTIPFDSPPGTYLGQLKLTNAHDVELISKKKMFHIDYNFRLFTSNTFDRPTTVEDEISAIRHDVLLTSVPLLVHVVAPNFNDFSSTVGFSTQTVPIREEITTSKNTWIYSKINNTVLSTSVSSSHGPLFPTNKSLTNNVFAFFHPLYFAFVPEGEYTHGIRLAIKPESLAVIKNTSVRFEIDDSAGDIPFFLTSDGQLIVFDVDRESRAIYNFLIKAISPRFGVAWTRINVAILDVNDNYPVFDSSPSVIGILRDIGVGTSVFKFTAHDLDTENNGAVRYGLEESGSPFNVDSSSEHLTI